MSRQGNNYDNKYYKNTPYASGTKGPGGNGSFGGGSQGGQVTGGGQIGAGGAPGSSMNWGMYGGTYSGNRHSGENRGFNSSQGPSASYNSSGGGQFGSNVRGTSNTRGGVGSGGYNRHGDKGADYFVQDEVVGSGTGSPAYPPRKAPPAHSGPSPAHSGSQYPTYQTASQMFGQHAPPQAHGGMYSAYQGYGGANYTDYFGNWVGGERFPRGYGGDKVGSDREERDQEKPNLSQLPKSLSVTRFNSGFQNKDAEPGITNKDVRDSHAFADAPEDASDIPKQSGVTSVERTLPPTSPGAPSIGGNRRKQSTPQKVPTSPGSATLIITQKGLSPPETNSPQHETPFISPKVFQPSKQGSPVGKVSPLSHLDKSTEKQCKPFPSPPKPFPSSPKPVLKLSIIERSSDESDALVIDTGSPGVSKTIIPSPTKLLKTNEKLLLLKEDNVSVEGSKDAKVLARQSTEGNLADKEDGSDDDIKIKSIVRKKRLGKSDGPKKLDESDSEAESPHKTKRSPKDNKNEFGNNDSAKGKTSRSPKPPKTVDIREASKQEKGFIVPQVKELKEADLTSVRRRRSKGEMKEFPCDVNLATEESSPQKQDVGGRRRRLSSGTQATKKKIFQQVEEDLEAMFAGLEDSDPEKRSKKKKTSSESASDEPKERKKPGPKPKSKEESIETPKMKPATERRKPGPKPRYNMDPDKNEGTEKEGKDEYSFDPEEFELSPKSKSERKKSGLKASSDLEEFELSPTPKQERKKAGLKASSDLEDFEVSPKPKLERKKPGPKPGFKRETQEQKAYDGDEILKEIPPKPERKKPGPKPGSRREKRTLKNAYSELDDYNNVFEESSLHSPEKSKTRVEVKVKTNQGESTVNAADQLQEVKSTVDYNTESTVVVVNIKKSDPDSLEQTGKRGSDTKDTTIKDEIIETDSPSTPKRSTSRLRTEVKMDESTEKSRPRRRRSDIVESPVDPSTVAARKDGDDSEKRGDNSRLAVRTGGKSKRIANTKSPQAVLNPEIKMEGMVSPKARKEENAQSKPVTPTRNSEMFKNEVKLIKIISPKARAEASDPDISKTEIKETRTSGRKRKTSALDNLESPNFSLTEEDKKDVPKAKKRKSDYPDPSTATTDKKPLPPLEKSHRTSRRARGLPVDSKDIKSTENPPEKSTENPSEKSTENSPKKYAENSPKKYAENSPKKYAENQPESLSDNIKKILESSIQMADTRKNDLNAKPNVDITTDDINIISKNKEEDIENNDEDIIEVIKEIPFGGFLEKANIKNKDEDITKVIDEIPLESTKIEISLQKEAIDTISKQQPDSSEKETSVLESEKETSVLESEKDTSVIESEKDTSVIESEKDTSVIESPRNSFALIHSTLDDSFSEDSPGKSSGKKRGRPFGSKNRSKDERDLESDKEKRKIIKKDKSFIKVTDTDKENGSTSKNSSAKTSRRASVEDSSKGKGGKKKVKKQNEVEMLLEKFKGPFIHINGDFNSPLEVRVINSALDSLDSSNKQSKSRAICDKEQRAKVSNFGHTSTLSRQYDHKNLDDSWVCVFCNQTTHWKGLGDLFGPYWIPSNLIKTPQKKRPEAEIKSSSVEGVKKNKRRRKSSLTEERLNDSSVTTIDSNDTTESEVSEIWFHEDCLCWVPCVYLVGSKIVGLEEAVDQTSETVCGCCNNRGASVGCCSAGCRQTAHVSCAQRDGWSLNIDTFIATCTKHV